MASLRIRHVDGLIVLIPDDEAIELLGTSQSFVIFEEEAGKLVLVPESEDERQVRIGMQVFQECSETFETLAKT